MNTITISVPLDQETKITEIYNTSLERKIGLIFESEGEFSVSDNYHSMDELYEHRYALFYALIKIYDNYITPMGTRIKCWKSKLHSDGTMFDDSFIVGMTIPNSSFEPDKPPLYITYHYPMSWWNKFNVIALPNAPKWDGHTSDDVIERLMKL